MKIKKNHITTAMAFPPETADADRRAATEIFASYLCRRAGLPARVLPLIFPPVLGALLADCSFFAAGWERSLSCRLALALCRRLGKKAFFEEA